MEIFMQYEDILNILKGREVLYSILSDFYLYLPEHTHIELLSNTLPYIKSMAEDSDNKLLQSGVLGLDKFILLYNSSNNKESLIEDLNMSYTRLYCLGNSVSISESVYLSPEHLVNQDMEVESLYKRDGFQMNHSSNEPLDHLSYELKYMSYLSKQLYISYKNNLLDKQSELINKQQDFLCNHLLQWVGEFLNVTSKYETSYLFYKPLSEFLLGYLTEDSQLLSSVCL